MGQTGRGQYLLAVQLLVFVFGAVAIQLLCGDHGEAERILGPYNRHPFECGMLITATAVCTSLCWRIIAQDRARKRLATSAIFISSMSFLHNFLLHQGYSPVALNYFGRYVFPIRVVSWATTLPVITHVSGELSDIPYWQVVIYKLMGPGCMVFGLTGIWTTKLSVLVIGTSLSVACYVALLYGFWEMFNLERSKLRNTAPQNVLTLILCYITLNFLAFPAIWAAGAAGLISTDVENYGLMIADAMFKVVFDSFLLGGSFASVEYRQAADLRGIGAREKEALANELLNSIQKQSHFVASISHELRTPLNGIIGLSENIIEVNLREVVEHVIDLTIPLVKRGVKIVNKIAEDFPLMDGDPERLTAVFHNLLGNAAKFTEEGSISVSALVLDRTSPNPTVQVLVEDTGIGIPQDKLQQIFGEFEQVDSSTSRQYGGTGLGLSLVEKLVCAHNGTVKVESMLGRGSTFVIDLPLTQPPEGTPPPPPKQRKSSWNTISFWRYPKHRSSRSSDNASGTTSITPSTLSSPFCRGTSSHSCSRPLADESVVTREAPLKQLPPTRDLPWEKQERTQLESRQGRPVTTSREAEGQIHILSVDDDKVNQMVVEGILLSAGYKVTKFLDGNSALKYLESATIVPDLILLDVMMPDISGFRVCEILRERFPANVLPIIMASAKSQEVDIVEGLKCDSNDYIVKPIRRFELLARINAQLKLRKLWRNQLEAEKRDVLLKQTLPKYALDRLCRGETLVANYFPDVTIIFSSITGITTRSDQNSAPELIQKLSAIITAFDTLADNHGAHKIPTTGATYAAVTGLDGSRDHAECAINMASAMLEAINDLSLPEFLGDKIKVRIGVHSGPAYGGVVGTKCLHFCMLGDTIDKASLMERSGLPMAVHASDDIYRKLSQSHEFVSLEPRRMKQRDIPNTYLLKCGDHERALQLHEENARESLSTGTKSTIETEDILVKKPLVLESGSNEIATNDTHQPAHSLRLAALGDQTVPQIQRKGDIASHPHSASALPSDHTLGALPVETFAFLKGEEDEDMRAKPKANLAGGSNPAGYRKRECEEGGRLQHRQRHKVVFATSPPAEVKSVKRTEAGIKRTRPKAPERSVPELGANSKNTDGQFLPTTIRRAAHKSPTCLDKTQTMQGGEMKSPGFSVHDKQESLSFNVENPLFRDKPSGGAACLPATHHLDMMQPPDSSCSVGTRVAKEDQKSLWPKGTLALAREMRDLKMDKGPITTPLSKFQREDGREKEKSSSSCLPLKATDNKARKGHMQTSIKHARREEERRKLHNFLAPLQLKHYVPIFLKEEFTKEVLEQLSMVELQGLTFLSKGAILRIYHRVFEDDCSLTDGSIPQSMH